MCELGVLWILPSEPRSLRPVQSAAPLSNRRPFDLEKTHPSTHKPLPSSRGSRVARRRRNNTTRSKPEARCLSLALLLHAEGPIDGCPFSSHRRRSPLDCVNLAARPAHRAFCPTHAILDRPHGSIDGHTARTDRGGAKMGGCGWPARACLVGRLSAPVQTRLQQHARIGIQTPRPRPWGPALTRDGHARPIDPIGSSTPQLHPSTAITGRAMGRILSAAAAVVLAAAIPAAVTGEYCSSCWGLCVLELQGWGCGPWFRPCRAAAGALGASIASEWRDGWSWTRRRGGWREPGASIQPGSTAGVG